DVPQRRDRGPQGRPAHLERGVVAPGGHPVHHRRRTRTRGVAMTAMIEARGLTKHYAKTRALDGLDLTAQSGQVVAVLGPNGAGKTTFVRTVATLLRPDEGTLHVAGHD